VIETDDSLDVEKLEREVKGVYEAVAGAPDGEFHLEMRRDRAERLGYPSALSIECPPLRN
jgi:hypothetical protein